MVDNVLVTSSVNEPEKKKKYINLASMQMSTGRSCWKPYLKR